jgi:1-aminocyclopropane-1-carboxylate deaminase/D-cysteine desulfhydrase-like pyridoxal-dependent ACC family enzyme
MPLSHSTDALKWFHLIAREKIVTQSIRSYKCEQNEISWDILRTDLIHPVCSGNKFFKLRYYLEDAITNGHDAVHTFGGAWSNHIVATAFSAQACGLSSTGYIRGEEPAVWSQTLKDAQAYGMKLVFLTRTAFDQEASSTFQLPTSTLIPMGGYGEKGAKGASEILHYAAHRNYTHIFCAAGTGTMAAGLCQTAGEAQVWVVNVVSANNPTTNNLLTYIKALTPNATPTILNSTFGGFAKSSPALINFMNRFHQQNSIPTDFVYTARLMFAIEDLLHKKVLPKGSRILAIHSGGLQGNNSLKSGLLGF